MTPRQLLTLAVAALMLVTAAPASAKTLFPGIHAHRGGPLTNGQATHPENSLEAFRNAHALGADVIELDAKLTSDNVPVIMHDATLDRTTNCAGTVRSRTAADLAANCRIDTLGTDDKIVPASGPGVAIPTLAEVLAWAKSERAKLHLEIKNQPTDPDYDATPAFAQTVVTAVEASGIDGDDVLIQSFWIPNLDEARARGFQTTFLLLKQTTNQQSIDVARDRGYTVLSPPWPIDSGAKQFVDAAHKAGKPVIPYTIDDGAEIAKALDAGVDGVITNDTAVGLRTYYGPICKSVTATEKRLAKKYRARVKAYRAERNAARRKRLREGVLSARKGYTRAKRQRAEFCAKAGA
jgi:glycerophosphoryl diester phosphodiesterase